MLQIIDNLQNIRGRIADAEREHNRGQGSVTLVGVSRKQPMGILKTVADEGLKHFGEVHIQETIAKIMKRQ